MSSGGRLTRREALARAAAVAAVGGGGSLLGAPGARAAAGTGGARGPGGAVTSVFAHPVGRLAPGAVVRVTPARRFCLAALGWQVPAHARIELRTRRPDGSFGPWAIASSGGHRGDGDGDAASGVADRIGEGIWTGPAGELELRNRGPEAVEGIRVELVAGDAVDIPAPQRSGFSAAAAEALPRATPDLPAGPGQPPIIARRAWAGAHHRPTHGPFYGGIQMGVVHHTENPNGYAASDVPAMLRAIYEFHVHGRGWFDIGYNFVVDRFGRIWEAREGGIDLPVIGAQAGDWNAISFGVSMLGTFSDVLPSPAALAALQRLLAWKMALSGVPVTGEIDEVVAADDVSYTQFRAGEHVRFPRIAGHRDVDSTDCPGDVLDGHLPVLRSRVARVSATPATLSLTASITAVTSGHTLILTGRLARVGAPIAAAPVMLQTVRAPGLTPAIAQLTTDEDGRFAHTLSLTRPLLLRALHAAAPAVASPILAVSPSLPGIAPPVADHGGR